MLFRLHVREFKFRQSTMTSIGVIVRRKFPIIIVSRIFDGPSMPGAARMHVTRIIIRKQTGRRLPPPLRRQNVYRLAARCPLRRCTASRQKRKCGED